MTSAITITGTGLYTPPQKISNEELVESFNTYVDEYNQVHKTEIETGLVCALEYSSVSFIEKASGIHTRYVMDKKGILDPKRMRPFIAPRSDEEASIQCEMALNAIHQAVKYMLILPRLHKWLMQPKSINE